MTRFSDLVTKSARRPKSPPDARANTSAQVIKLDSNENPFGPSPLAVEGMRAALTSSHRYPEDHCDQLRTKLATLHDVPPEQLLVTPGSTGMLSLLCQALLGPGLNAVTSALSFIVYGMVVRATGARLIETPALEDGFDLDAIIEAINPETRLVFVANPNNPTGTMHEAAAIDKFLARVPAHVVVVLDEAYYEFAARFAALRGLQYSRSLDYVRQGKKIVVLRTFSKVHGLAGLRIGYGIGSAEILASCAGIANTYAVSSMAQAAALAALEDQQHIERTLANNSEQADILFGELGRLGFRAIPTSANFVYFDTGKDASSLAARLLAGGISVRPLGAWGAPQAIRVSIGTPEQNQIFMEAVQREVR